MTSTMHLVNFNQLMIALHKRKLQQAMACKCTISVTESYYVEQIAGRRGTRSKCKSILKQRTHEQVLSEE